MNQAILIVHEQVYVFGQSIGHETSDEIRPIVMKFFASVLDRDDQDPEFLRAAGSLRYSLVKMLGDYVLYFSDQDGGSEFHGLAGQGSRYESFKSYLTWAREAVFQCREQKGVAQLSGKVTHEQAQLFFGCQAEVLDSARLIKQLSPEQTLLYLATSSFDKALGIANPEWMYVPVNSKADIIRAELELARTCKLVSPIGIKLNPVSAKPSDYELQAMAWHYCTDKGIRPVDKN